MFFFLFSGNQRVWCRRIWHEAYSIASRGSILLDFNFSSRPLQKPWGQVVAEDSIKKIKEHSGISSPTIGPQWRDLNLYPSSPSFFLTLCVQDQPRCPTRLLILRPRADQAGRTQNLNSFAIIHLFTELYPPLPVPPFVMCNKLWDMLVMHCGPVTRGDGGGTGSSLAL